MAIVGYLLCVSFYFLRSSDGQTVTLSVTPPSPVVGQDVTLTCRVSPDITTDTTVNCRRNTATVVEFTVTSMSCTPVTAQGGQNYTFTCGALPVRQMTITIPAAYVTEDEHGTDWTCNIFYGATSNTVQLTLRVPVYTVTKTTDGAYRPSVTIKAGNSQTFTCTTDASRPVARLSWFRGYNNVTDQAGAATDQDIGDNKYTRQQSLTIIGAVNDVDSGLKCEAVNIEGRTPVSSQTSNVTVQWEPQTDPSLTRDPPTTTLTEGVSVTLTCRQTGGKPLATLTWSGVCSGATPTYSSDTTTVTSSVQFSVSRTYNGQTCTCESRHLANSYLKSLRETFVVLFGPDTVTVTGNQQIVADGVRTMTLTCRTAPYHLYVTLTWARGETTLTGASSPTNSSSANGGTMTSQVLTLTPDRTWDGDTITCTAVTLGTAIQRTGAVQLDLLYQPHITLSSVPSSPIIEGRQLVLTCDVDSNPLSNVTWSRPGNQSLSGTAQPGGVLLIPSVSRHDDGTYRCTAINSQKTNTMDMVISVYYPPDHIAVTYSIMTDGDTSGQLRCTPAGNPRLFTFSKWQHLSINGQLVREHDGMTIGHASVLTLPDAGLDTSYQDTGYYVCRVENGVPGRNNQMVFSQSVYVSVQSPPVFVSNVSLFTGQLENAAVIFIPSYSTTEYHNVELASNNVVVDSRFVLLTIPANISVPFFRTQFMVNGFSTVIAVQNLKENDFGRYVLTVSNDIGSQQFEFYLKETDISLRTTDDSIYHTGVAMLSTGVVLLLINMGIIGCLIIRKGRLPSIITMIAIKLPKKRNTTNAKPETSIGFGEIITSSRGNGEDDRLTYEEIERTDRAERNFDNPTNHPSNYENTTENSQEISSYESLQGRSKSNVYDELDSQTTDNSKIPAYINTAT